MSEDVTLRPITDADASFLYEIYASTRVEELAPTNWDDEQKTAFLRQQFTAQHAHYQEHFRDASFDLLLSGGRPIGRLYVRRLPGEIRIVDIALLPDWRGRGIGGAIVERLIAEAHASGKPVRIHVEKQNPALRFYERLGFVPIEDKGVYLFLECPPADADGSGTSAEK